MPHTNPESATKRLLTKLKREVDGHALVEQNPPRSERYLDSLIADALERRDLSLGARALLAWLHTRQPDFVIFHSLHRAVGGDRIAVQAAVRELEVKGFAKHVKPGRWEFSAVPSSDSGRE